MKGCQTHPVEVAHINLASLASIRAFAAGFNARGLSLSVLVCNAGIMAPPERIETEDGLEQQFQVSTLNHAPPSADVGNHQEALLHRAVSSH